MLLNIRFTVLIFEGEEVSLLLIFIVCSAAVADWLDQPLYYVAFENDSR